MATYKRGRRFQLGTTNNNSSKWQERDTNPGLPDCQSDTMTTRPRCLQRCYDVFLSNEESENSIEDCLNLTCFRTFTALHWKRDVSKEPFQFILETSYR